MTRDQYRKAAFNERKKAKAARVRRLIAKADPEKTVIGKYQPANNTKGKQRRTKRMLESIAAYNEAHKDDVYGYRKTKVGGVFFTVN